MEIQKPQNTHLEQLVKNMDGVVTDPNQCLICKRPLSCKSALMVRNKSCPHSQVRFRKPKTQLIFRPSKSVVQA